MNIKMDNYIEKPLNQWEENNWNVYKKKYPDNIVTNQQFSGDIATEILPSRSGLPTMRATTRGGQSVFFHSSFDPVREAKRVASSLEAKAGDVVIVFGLALGYLVEALLAQLDKQVPLFIIEPDIRVFQLAMETRDLSSILVSERVYLQVGDSKIDIRNHFFAFYDVSRFHNIVLTGLPGHQTLYSDFYIESMTVIKQIVNSVVMELRTLANSGYDIVSSTILNFTDYCTKPGVKSLYGKYSGIPAIIVAAGPSLDNNITLLREAKGRAVIIAVGTAVKALQKHGIAPDFIASIDAGAWNYEHFKEYNNQDTALLTDIQTYPKILQTFQGTIFISAFQSFIKSWTDGVVEDKGSLETGGTVANSAMTVAYKMGANPIIFIGQDLAYARDGHTHADGTNYGECVSKVSENEEYFYVKANDGGKVLTTRVLDYFRSFFEEWIQVHSDRIYINATEGGAFIEGTKIMTLRDVINKYCCESVNVQSVVFEAQREYYKLPEKEAIAILYRRLSDAERIFEVVKSVLKRLRQLKQACEQNDVNKAQKYVRNMNKTFKQFEEDPYICPVVEILAHHTIHHINYRRATALYAGDNDIEKVISDYEVYYQKIYEEVKHVKDLIKQAIMSAEERYN